jgi:hypothetical protein
VGPPDVHRPAVQIKLDVPRRVDEVSNSADVCHHLVADDGGDAGDRLFGTK